MNTQLITPIILAGGAGTRLWPVSREESPKQFCRLLNGESLFQTTVKRVSDPDRFSAPIIVTGKAYGDLVEQQLAECNIAARAIICEPLGRDTAPAIAAALIATSNTSANQPCLVLPSDHWIEDEDAFLRAIRAGSDLIREHSCLVTFGIKPNRAETGFGYIQASETKLSLHASRIARFIEKPSESMAEKLIQDPKTSWNAGIFLFYRKDILEEMEMHCPAVLHKVRKSVSHGNWTGLKLNLAGCHFSSAPKISIDYAVMEHTRRAAIVPMNPGWSDLGSWDSLWEHRNHDKNGNYLEGDVLSVDTSGSLVVSDGPMVAVAGLDDVVVVANDDAVLVTRRDQTQSVKTLVECMKSEGRREQKSHTGEDRPWGRFDSIDRGESHQVKRIRVDTGGRLSLQYHHHRAEHWVVVSGTARVTVDNKVMDLGPCEQVFIPQGAVHRLENVTDEPVEIIEVQYGSYLGEDDIVRIEDVYGREQEPGTAPGAQAAA